MQRKVFSSTVEVPHIQLSPVTVDIPVVLQRRPRLPSELVLTAMKGFLAHFAPFFRAPPVMPELSASFSSFRVLTTVSARGVPESPGVLPPGDSALGLAISLV